MRKIGIVLITVLGLISCSDHNEPVINSDNLLLVNWSEAHYENGELSFYSSMPYSALQGYIAYSNKIDTEIFLQKVATYTQAEKQYKMGYCF